MIYNGVKHIEIAICKFTECTKLLNSLNFEQHWSKFCGICPSFEYRSFSLISLHSTALAIFFSDIICFVGNFEVNINNGFLNFNHSKVPHHSFALFIISATTYPLVGTCNIIFPQLMNAANPQGIKLFADMYDGETLGYGTDKMYKVLLLEARVGRLVLICCCPTLDAEEPLFLSSSRTVRRTQPLSPCRRQEYT